LLFTNLILPRLMAKLCRDIFSEHRAVTVREKLYSKAMVIESDGNVSIIISIDTCFMPPELHDIVTERIYKFTGVSSDCVSITSNHTHFGDPVSEYSLKNCSADKTYTDVYIHVIVMGNLAIYMLPGEMFATYGLRIKAE